MPHYVGPCEVCGTPIDRMLRPGRRPKCVPCAIDGQLAYTRQMAEGTNPDLERCRAAGAAAAADIAAKKGRTYEKWKKGMMRAASGKYD